MIVELTDTEAGLHAFMETLPISDDVGLDTIETVSVTRYGATDTGKAHEPQNRRTTCRENSAFNE